MGSATTLFLPLQKGLKCLYTSSTEQQDGMRHRLPMTLDKLISSSVNGDNRARDKTIAFAKTNKQTK